MKLYVGNLSFNPTENDLEDLFSQHGTVSEVALMTDRATGRSRGFAFVTMGNETEGNAAIEATHGKAFAGRKPRRKPAFLIHFKKIRGRDSLPCGSPPFSAPGYRPWLGASFFSKD